MSNVAGIVSPGLLCNVFYPRISNSPCLVNFYTHYWSHRSWDTQSIYPLETVIMQSKEVNIEDNSDKRTGPWDFASACIPLYVQENMHKESEFINF